jgi:hypothetical protein
MANNKGIFTEKQLGLICKMHKYSRIFQLLNIRTSEFYAYVHSFLIFLMMLLNVSMTIINLNIKFVEKNPVHNSIALICNTVVIALDILLSFQIKKEYHKTKSIEYNGLANDIEEDLIIEDINNLEFNRILKKFKDLMYTENNKIPLLILRKEKKQISVNIKELEELKILNIMNLIKE